MDNNVENNINSEFNGLTVAEVNARIEAGKINIADDSSDRTTGKIIRDNLLTYFNLIFLVFVTYYRFLTMGEVDCQSLRGLLGISF